MKFIIPLLLVCQFAFSQISIVKDQNLKVFKDDEFYVGLLENQKRFIKNLIKKSILQIDKKSFASKFTDFSIYDTSQFSINVEALAYNVKKRFLLPNLKCHVSIIKKVNVVLNPKIYIMTDCSFKISFHNKILMSKKKLNSITNQISDSLEVGLKNRDFEHKLIEKLNALILPLQQVSLKSSPYVNIDLKSFEITFFKFGENNAIIHLNSEVRVK